MNNLTAILFVGALPIVFFGIGAIYRAQTEARSRRAVATATAVRTSAAYAGAYGAARRRSRYAASGSRAGLATVQRRGSGLTTRY